MHREHHKRLVSIIIPCFNEASGIRTTLKAIILQDFPEDQYEVIVVDNNSTDNSHRAALEFSSVLPALRVEKEVRRGSYAARNRGIRLAVGDTLVFLDTHMTVGSDWLRTGTHVLQQNAADYMGCRIKLFAARDRPTTWELYDMTVGFPVADYVNKFGFAPTACLFVKKDVVKEVGMFDPRLMSGGDLEFGNRVRDAGFKMHYSHDTVMWHPARATLLDSVHKSRRVARGHVDLKWHYPERYGQPKLLSLLSSFINMAWLKDVRKPGGTGNDLRLIGAAAALHLVRVFSQIRRYVELKITKSP